MLPIPLEPGHKIVIGGFRATVVDLKLDAIEIEWELTGERTWAPRLGLPYHDVDDCSHCNSLLPKGWTIEH
jgi:hypothetical protein